MEKELTSAMIWSLFDSLHEGILIAETDGTILYCNEAAGALLNLASDVSSLQAIGHLLPTSNRWQDCLEPPFSTTIIAGNGRPLTLNTHPIDLNNGGLIQVVISPEAHPATQNHADNNHLFQQAVDRSREFELLLNSSNAFSSTLDKETILSTLAQQAIEANKAAGCTIYQWLPTHNELMVLRDLPPAGETAVSPTGTRLAIPNSPILATVLKRQQAQTVHLTAADTGNLPLPAWTSASMRLCTLIPLVLTGETYGFVQLLSENGRLPNATHHEQQLLIALANQAASALEIALIFEDTYERERFYGAMGNVSLALNSSLDRETVLNLICSEGRRIFNVDGAYIWQLEGDHFVGSAAAGHGAAEFLGT
ncbi:MAG: GAF domain-containing protein, partial [Candidatus Promineifilaceae bacterium]